MLVKVPWQTEQFRSRGRGRLRAAASGSTGRPLPGHHWQQQPGQQLNELQQYEQQPTKANALNTSLITALSNCSAIRSV